MFNSWVGKIPRKKTALTEEPGGLVPKVTKSQTRLKQLSTHKHTIIIIVITIANIH